jgi:hypothetical protein
MSSTPVTDMTRMTRPALTPAVRCIQKRILRTLIMKSGFIFIKYGPVSRRAPALTGPRGGP